MDECTTLEGYQLLFDQGKYLEMGRSYCHEGFGVLDGWDRSPNNALEDN